MVRRAAVNDPAYTDAERELVYGATLDRAVGIPDADRSAVVDGTFDRAGYRDRARRAAVETGARFRLVWVTRDPAVARERTAAREGDASDADARVYEGFRDSFERPERGHDRIDNPGDLAATRARVAALF